MAVDTLMSFVGTYDSVEDAEADDQLVKTLHTEAGDRPGGGAVPFATSRNSVSTWMAGTAGLVVVDASEMGARSAAGRKGEDH